MTIKFHGLTPLAWPTGVMHTPTMRQLKWMLPVLIREEDNLFSESNGSLIPINGLLFPYKDAIFLICDRISIDKDSVSIFLVYENDCKPRQSGHFTVRSMISINSEFDIDKLLDQIIESCDLLIVNNVHES